MTGRAAGRYPSRAPLDPARDAQDPTLPTKRRSPPTPPPRTTSRTRSPRSSPTSASGGGPGRPPRSLALKLAAVGALALVVGGGLLAYRAHHRRKVVEAALSQADALLRLDTAAGYRQAASLLEPIAQLDPMSGASVRAFALAMLFADYREGDAEAEVENLLVVPGARRDVPPHAQLAAAALALGRKEAGTATTAARARRRRTVGARDAGADRAPRRKRRGGAPARRGGRRRGGVRARPRAPRDVLRRLRQDPAAARAAYEAALAASPAHPRATYGLAKLALAGHAPLEQAQGALLRLLDDRQGTPAVERARAALHLAALRLRAGERAAADAALDAAGLDAGAARVGRARGRRRRGAPRAVPRRGGRPGRAAERERRRPGRALAEPAAAPPRRRRRR